LDLASHSHNNHRDNYGRNAARRHVSTTHRETCWDPSAGSFGYLFNAVPFLAHLESSATPFCSPSPPTMKERECGEGKEAVGAVGGGGEIQPLRRGPKSSRLWCTRARGMNHRSNSVATRHRRGKHLVSTLVSVFLSVSYILRWVSARSRAVPST
jgi:hypothetical protein